VAAVIWRRRVDVLLIVMLLAFGVEIETVVWVKMEVTIFETTFGVEVCISRSEIVSTCSFVTGGGVSVVETVIFEVSSLIEVADGPRIVTVVETISLRVDVLSLTAGVAVERELKDHS